MGTPQPAVVWHLASSIEHVDAFSISTDTPCMSIMPCLFVCVAPLPLYIEVTNLWTAMSGWIWKLPGVLRYAVGIERFPACQQC